MEKVNRIVGIDYLKTFGIYLMILGHSPFLPDKIETVIYSFHMPLFFFISGVLYKDVEFDKILKGGIRSLLIPYLLINLMCLGMWSATECFHGNFLWSSFLSRIGAVSLGLGIERFGLIPVCAPTWFFLALFWSRLATCLFIRRIHGRFSKIIFIIILLLLLHLLNNFKIQLPFALSSALMALPIMLFAFEYKRTFFLEKSAKYQVTILFIALLLAVPSFIINNQKGRCDMDAVWFGESIMLYYIDAIASCVFLFILFNRLTRESTMITNISIGTIAIVGFHLTIAYCVCKLDIWQFFNSIIASIVESLLVLIVCYPIILISKIYFPILIGKKRKYE